MKIEVRPARQKEMEEFRRVATTSLVISSEIMPPEAVHMIRPEMTLCAFAEGRLATSYAVYPLNMRFNGTSMPVAGVTFVGTLPIYRSNGCLRKVIEKHFEILHEKGKQPIAALYASRASIYHRYGYGIVSNINSYKIEPGYLQFASKSAFSETGVLKEFGDDEFQMIRELYKRFIADRTGYIHRGRATWDAGALWRPPKGGLLGRVIYEEEGEPSGYVIYTVEPQKTMEGQPWQRLSIRDLVWLKPSAYSAIWNYLSGMKLADNIYWMRVPTDDPLSHLLLEPRELNIRTRDGVMARIVDVEKALTARPYAEEGRVIFEVIDEMCPWNTGTWRMETSGAETEVSSTDEAPEAAMSIDTLTMIFFGQTSVTEAAQMGRVEVLEDNVLTKYDNIFKTKYKPFCADFF
jgi:predicted acetyltransferase